jgi:hypothetical protein
MRQAQALKASLPNYVRVAMIMMSDSTIPRVGEVCSQPV